MINIGSESEIIEFKKSTSELTEGIISLVAMLNKHGEGALYFGVKNNGDVIGQKDLTDSTVRDVSHKISEGIKPQVIPTISVEYYENLKVIKVVAKGKNIPYSAFEKYYLRSFDEDRQVTPNILAEMLNSKGEPDLIIEEESSRSKLSFKILKNLFVINGLTVNEKTFEANNKLLTKSKKYNYMAELLADENDVSIKVVTFAGKDKSVMIKRTEYGYKCLISALDNVIQYIESINETKVKLGGLQRKEEKYFDSKAFKEAWLNACVHTRWIEKIPPVVYIYDDRIEIVSNGGLPKALSKKDFFKGISKPVNNELLNIFLKLDLIEQTGHGVPMIYNEYGKDAFYISEHTVIVTIPINKELLENVENTTNDSNRYLDLSAYELNAFNLIKNNTKITTSILSSTLNLSKSYCSKILVNLKTKGYIERIGSKKSGYWKIINK